jgi:chemotaxis methyl-accepting protein methylase
MPRTPSPGKRLKKKVSAKRDRTSDVKRKRSVESGKPESVRNKPTAIEKIFTVLHKTVEIDFSHYRLSTIQRQLQRRIARSGETDIDRYTALIEKDPREALFLAQELLLPVTEFFRHPATFTVLNKKVFPVLAEHMTGRTPLRIWVPGCSTG